MIGAVVVILKVVDYGWTAYDAYQAGKVLNDPNASLADRNTAALTVSMAVVAEAIEPDDLLPISLPLDDLARHGIIAGSREAFVQTAIRSADNNVARYGIQGSIDAARAAARNGVPVLPGVFKYGDALSIEGYQLHHLWPEGLGGPKNGWAVYVQNTPTNWHTATGGIQDWVDKQLMHRTGRDLAAMRAWARANPNQLLPLLREIYLELGIDFPY